MNITPPICSIIYLFLSLISLCMSFPYIEPSADSHRHHQQNEQKQNEQTVVQTQNAIKDKIDGESDKSLYFQRGEGNFESAEAENHLAEKETKYGHSVKDVSELRFPLDTVITQIEDEDTNQFPDQMELSRQGDDNVPEKETAPLEKAKLTFHPSSSADNKEKASSTSSSREMNSSTIADNEETPNETKDGRFYSIENKNGTEEEDKGVAKTANKSEKLEEAIKANDGNGKDENGTLRKDDGKQKGMGKQQIEQQDNVQTIPPVPNRGNATRSLPPIIDVADFAPAEPNDRQFSVEQKEDDEDRETELTWWDKIVLGLRCARHDCRETLIAGEENLPKVITGWKITRRARSTNGVDERKKNLEIQFCKCNIQKI